MAKGFKNCLCCGKEIYGRESKKFCNYKCAKELNPNQYKKKPPIEKQCKNCNKTFIAKSKTNYFCAVNCQIRHSRDNLVSTKNKDKETVECLICNSRYLSLTGHLFKRHKITTEQYREMFPSSTLLCEETSKKLSINIMGDKNPGYQHGGKLSPWSNKNVKLDTEQIAAAKKKAKDNHISTATLEYYINKGYSEEDAIKLRSKRQRTFTLEKCIEKHGEEEGKRIHRERQEKWMATLNSKSDEEISDINRRKAWTKASTSDLERKVYDEITKYVQVDFHFQACRNINVDIHHNNRIVEVFGDFWHFHPTKYRENDYNKVCKIKAITKWKRDKARLEKLKECGYEVAIIWESELSDNFSLVIQNCIDFLKFGLKHVE
jgi:hypothetical protein